MTDRRVYSDSYVPDLQYYWLHFTDTGQRMRFSDIVPKGICPFLLHSCLPYIHTFHLGGSFPWMQLEENRESVLVQCPNAKDGVVAIVYKSGDDIFVRVDRLKGICLFGHRIADNIRLNPQTDIKVPLTVVDASFAWLTYLDRSRGREAALSPQIDLEDKGRKLSFKVARLEADKAPEHHFSRICSCLQKPDSIRLKLSSYEHRCRYFKWPKRDYFHSNNLGPEGLCIDLFHLSHMYATGSIYGDKRAHGQVIIACGDRQGGVKLSIKVRKARTYLLRRLLFNILKRMKIKTEVPDMICELEVQQAEDCPMGHRPGMRFIYNMGSRYELCPAAFDNIYFAVHNLVRGQELIWPAGKDGKGAIACPSIESDAAFDLYKDGRS